MKKLFLALALVALPVYGAEQMVVSTTPTSVPPIVCKGADANNYGKYAASAASRVYSIGEAYTTVIQVYSDAGSTATVTIDVAPTATGPWYTVATITDPSATGETWSVPRSKYARINVTHTAGNVRGCISGWMNNKEVF